MTPAIGPRSAEQPTSQPKMYALNVPSNFHGISKMPTNPVINPPVRKEIKLGRRLEKSLEGETTLAATLVFSVAVNRAMSAMKATTGWRKRVNSTTGSQIASPNMTAEAEVTATPINEYR